MSYWDQQQQETLDQIQNQYNAQLAQLNATKQKALNDLATQKTQGLQTYQTDANNVDVNNAQQAEKLREILAGTGALYGGQNVTANLNLANERQNGLNTVTTNKNNFLSNIQSQVNNANNTYNANLTTLQNNTAADRLKAIQSIQQQKRAEELAEQQAAAKLAAQRSASSGGYATMSSNKGNDISSMAWDEMKRQYDNGSYPGLAGWFANNHSALLNSVGQTEYNKMVKALTSIQQQYNAARSQAIFDSKLQPW